MSREADLYKDKIEVSLDGRQIFYLFFGGAVIVGLVFVLGVMVGRRVEARGHIQRAHTSTAADPLAALDRLESNGGLSFKGALMAKGNEGAPVSDVERAIAERAKSSAMLEDKKAGEKVEKVVVNPSDKPADKPVDKASEKLAVKASDKPAVKASDKPADKPVDKPVEKASEMPADKPIDKASEKLTVKPSDKPADKPLAKASDKPIDKPIDKPVDKPADKAAKPVDKPADKPVLATDKPAAASDKPITRPADVAEKKPEEKKSKYTLQLSSFQDRGEADAFLASIKSAYPGAYVTEGTVEGKTYYRVRTGTYRSIDAANEAKAEVEKALKKSASVMKIRE